MGGVGEVQVVEPSQTNACRDASVAFTRKANNGTAVPRFTNSYTRKAFAAVATGSSG
jgi:hypothetical protein